MKGHWFWGCALDLSAERSQFLIDGHEAFGDVFISRALIRDIMFVRDPAVVTRSTSPHWADFYKPHYIKMMWKPFLGDGLVPNDGESWKRQHKLILPGLSTRSGWMLMRRRWSRLPNACSIGGPKVNARTCGSS